MPNVSLHRKIFFMSLFLMMRVLYATVKWVKWSTKISRYYVDKEIVLSDYNVHSQWPMFNEREESIKEIILLSYVFFLKNFLLF